VLEGKPELHTPYNSEEAGLVAAFTYEYSDVFVPASVIRPEIQDRTGFTALPVYVLLS
jgi:hypothetical protein